MMKTVFHIFTAIFFIFFSAKAQIRRSLGSPVNNPSFNEYAPSVNANNKMLIFESDRGVNGRWELYFATKNDKGRWNTPKPIEKINAMGNENDLIAGPSISYDSNILYFCASFEGGEGDMDIYYSIREGNDWSTPKSIGKPINSARYEGFPSISPDGKKLYFMRDNFVKRRDKEICYTIWVSEKAEDGTWAEPVLLPSPVNIDCEKTPRIMADGRTLIFSSVRAGGFGSFDLYQTFQEDDGSWSEPINLDYINTDVADQFASVSAAGDLMYYQNSGDIFTVTIPEKFRRYKLVTLEGKITDFINHQPIKAKVVMKSNIAKEHTALSINPDGLFQAILRIGSQYTFSINNVAGYLPHTSILNLTTNKEGEELQKNIELIPTKLPFIFQLFDKETKLPVKNPSVKIMDTETKTLLEVKANTDEAVALLTLGGSYKFAASALGYGFFSRNFKPDTTDIHKRTKKIPLSLLKKDAIITLSDITFETNSAELKADSFEEIDRLLKLLEDNTNLKLEISAHTDDVGNDEYNLKLSDKRAKSVVDYLTKKGIKPDRLVAKGYGEIQPLMPNDSDENRAKNRRVQFKIN